MKLGRVMSVRRTVMKLGRVVCVHGEQTQSRLLEKTHQSNGNLRKNNSVLMPKGELKLDPNRNPELGLARFGAGWGGGGAHACVVNQA